MNKLIAALSSAAVLSASAFVTPALAQSGTGSTNGGVASSTDLACMSAAIDVRESAIIAARTNFHAKIMTALSTRRDSLKAAFTIANHADRRVAISAALKVFAKAIADARTQYKVDVNAAWKVFAEASAKCKIAPDRGGNVDDDDDDDDGDDDRDNGKKKNRGLHLGQIFRKMKSKMGLKADVKSGAHMDLSF